MRLDLLYNPRALCERLAIESIRRKRLAKLKKTPGSRLSIAHIDSLELIELAGQLGIETIYDIGANVGTWSLLAKSIIPDAVVHAFEPLPNHHDRFIAGVAGAENIVLHRMALGSENTNNKELHVMDFSDASSMLPMMPGKQSQLGIRIVDRVPVKVCRLDDYRRYQQLFWPDLLKLDVQGYELEILKGATECLRAAKAIITEASFVHYYECQCFFHELVNYLAGFGFFVTAFGISTPLGKVVEQTDVLFARFNVDARKDGAI